MGEARNDLFQKLQPLSAQGPFEVDEAGDISAGPRQAVDESAADRIGDCDEYDRNGGCILLESGHRRGRDRHDHVRPQSRQLARVGSEPVIVAARPTLFEMDIAALGPTQLRKSPNKDSCEPPALGVVLD